MVVVVMVVKAVVAVFRSLVQAHAQYFQFKETPQSVAAKGFQKLEALTPGGRCNTASLKPR